MLTVSERGFGKRSSSYEYRISGRGGKGITAMIVNERNGRLVASFPVEESDQIMLVTDAGKLIRCPVDDVRIAGRNTQGVRIFKHRGGRKSGLRGAHARGRQWRGQRRQRHRRDRAQRLSRGRPRLARGAQKRGPALAPAGSAPRASAAHLASSWPVEGEHEILLVERLVAGEAVLQVGLVVDGLVGLEGLVLPLAVADLVGILAPQPARFSMTV